MGILKPYTGKFLLTMTVKESEDPRIDFEVEIKAVSNADKILIPLSELVDAARTMVESGEGCITSPDCGDCKYCNLKRSLNDTLTASKMEFLTRKDGCKHSSLRTTIDAQFKSARERIVNLIVDEMEP